MVPPHMTIITPSPIPKETDSKDPAKNRAKKLLKLEELGKKIFSTLFSNNPSLIF